MATSNGRWSGLVRGRAACPTRMAVWSEPGLSMTTTRRVGSGISPAGGAAASVRGAQSPNARSAAANADSASMSPTMASRALFGA